MTLQKKSSIVVMGGSFNPPTIAHLGLMEAAIRAVGAEKGVFVPVGEPYLKRKMRRQEDHIRLSEQMRTRMLSAMCSGRELWIVRWSCFLIFVSVVTNRAVPKSSLSALVVMQVKTSATCR